MAITLAFLIYLPVVAMLFAVLAPRIALLAALLGGWLLLPVAHFPPATPDIGFVWWIVGIGLPSDMLLTKAWIPPVVALIGGLARDPQTAARWRPSLIDLPMALWCVWPLADWLVARYPEPSPPLATLYLAGAWGAPWLIGRIWFADRAGGILMARALALAGAACLPMALAEGARQPWLYVSVYGLHPFRLDGVGRYLGYRPLGFFEHGNLYGLWTALCALAAIWVALNDATRDRRRLWLIVGGIDVAIALAAQSAGAIGLLLLGIVMMLGWRLPLMKPALIAGAAALALLAAIHLSGIVPLRAIAEHTSIGRGALAQLRAIGRGSFAWRVSQDMKTLPTIAHAPLQGTGRWDWWRPYNTRPWGQALLLIGQFGLIGLALAWGALIGAAVAALARLTRWGDRMAGDATLPLALIVLLALADAMFNAFFFAPAIVAAGAIAVRSVERRQPGRR